MPSTIEVTRGDLVESRHQVSVAVVDAAGRTVATSGDPDRVAFWRSCAKPFQAVPFIALGAAAEYGVAEEELALACASHNGEPRHVEVARRMLNRAVATEADLVCGPHASLNDELARAMVARGEQPTRLHNNCSGKHAAMILLARHQDWSRKDYADPAHPLQQSCLAAVAEWCGLPVSSVPHATDGCGVPSFAIPLRAMALAWARLGAVASGGRVPGIAEERQQAAALLGNAMRGSPFFIAGTARLDTDLIEATKGRIVAKVGAEGVYCAAIPELGLGIALKVEDGATRCLGPALLGVLSLLAPDITPALERHRHGDIGNTLSAVVGHVEARMELQRVALP